MEMIDELTGLIMYVCTNSHTHATIELMRDCNFFSTRPAEWAASQSQETIVIGGSVGIIMRRE